MFSQYYHQYKSFVFCKDNKLYIYTQMDNKRLVTILPNKLYWLSDVKPPKNIPNAFFFDIDEALVYEGFYEDFGPLNLAKIHKYISQVNSVLNRPQHQKNVFYHYTSTNEKKCANACLLMCCFMIVSLKMTSEDAFQRFKNIQFKPFRDASYGPCTYKCTILDCLRGFQYAIKLEWFNFKTFNLTQYQMYERVENGDLNWIVPDKFIAFSTPSDSHTDKYGNTLMTPKDYIPIFKKLGVTMVVRLNTKTYNQQQFIKAGIKHLDLYFTDGTSPPWEIVEKFLEETQKEEGAIAVHCKAGLGRTGSLIGCYTIKHYHFNAADFIGWIRLCRPGSILGPQQYFMIDNQKKLKALGVNSQIWKKTSEKFEDHEIEKQMNSFSVKDDHMSPSEKQIAINGQKGQGDYLVSAKKKINGLVH